MVVAAACELLHAARVLSETTLETCMSVIRRCLALALGLMLFVVASPAAAADAEVPAHLTLRVPSHVLGETRVVNVHVPPGYDGKASQAYPVLYMLDGGVKEDFPHVAAALDALMAKGEVPPMLLVGIENTERRRDLTGPTTVESDRSIATVVGGSAAFRSFIADELMPLVRTLYRVNDQSAIIGESLAGLFVVETLFVQPELFDTYIALDPSLWWNAQQWWREAGARVGSLHGVSVRFLLAAAGDSGSAAANLADALCRTPNPALNWTFVPRSDLRHANIYREFGPDALRMALSGQPLPTPDCANLSGN